MSERLNGYLMKGGGSVGATPKEIDEGIYGKLIRGELKHDPIAVVCSAPGKDPLDPKRKLTDHAIDALHASNMGNSEVFAANFDEIYRRFLPIATEVAHMSEAGFTNLMSPYYHAFDRGLSHAGVPEMIMAELLAEAIPGGKYINPAPYIEVDRRGNVRTPQIHQNRALLMDEIGSGIGIIPGFIARSSESGQVVTLDRGAGDTSAAYFSVLLDATCIIYTDSHGVMSADPRLVEKAETVERLTFREGAEATQGGTYVVHEKALAPLEAANSVMYVRHYKEDPTDVSIQTGIWRARRSPKDEMAKIITGVPNRHIIRIIQYGMNRSEGIIGKIGDIFADHDIPISDVATDTNSVTITTPYNKALEQVSLDLKKSIKGSRVKREATKDQHAAISIVGQNVARHSSKVIEMVGRTLAKQNVRIASMMMGSGAVSLTVYVPGNAYEDAVQALHGKFIEGE